MLVIVLFVRVLLLGRYRSGIVLDGVSRTQRFAFRAQQRQNQLLQRAVAVAIQRRVAGNYLSHGMRVCGWGQTGSKEQNQGGPGKARYCSVTSALRT